MYGYMGKILIIDLTDRKTSIIDTERYKDWIGGHGIGSALFWDLVEEKKISGFDPKNVVTIMTSPLSGTIAPGASGRTEVQGIGTQSYPVEWFTRSNFGGRFSAMLKYAGWDGIAIRGKADKPVWIDIREDTVKIRDASPLWGLDTWKTQEFIWREVAGKGSGTDRPDPYYGSGPANQKPAVVAIGPAGENLSRTACLIHDAGCASGQGGFGGVWGSKNLKAISAIGAKSVTIADPGALIEARLWAQKKFALDVDNFKPAFARFSPTKPQAVFWGRQKSARLASCVGCPVGCYERTSTGMGNGATCFATLFYSEFDRAKHKGKQTDAAYKATDLLQQYGINACEAMRGLQYIRDLNKMGELGPGKKIDCDLDFTKLGTEEFARDYLKKIAYREGIGDDFAEGFLRASKKWGRLEEDQKTGLLQYPYWGLPEHGYDPRAQVEWGYGSILGDRDINEHEFTTLFLWPSFKEWGITKVAPDPDWITKTISEKLIPFEGDQLMLDYSTDNIYSEHIAKLVAWHRRYSRFWKQSALYCDFRWSDFINTRTEDHRGISGNGEPKFLNAVTGENVTFLDGMNIGQKIWNLDNAIWTLQGRHRDMVHFPEYIYRVPFSRYGSKGVYAWYFLPGRENGVWKYIHVDGRHLDKKKFDEWKTRYYKLEGWDPATGWPEKKTLQSIGLSNVASELAKNNLLGKGL